MGRVLLHSPFFCAALLFRAVDAGPVRYRNRRSFLLPCSAERSGVASARLRSAGRRHCSPAYQRRPLLDVVRHRVDAADWACPVSKNRVSGTPTTINSASASPARALCQPVQADADAGACQRLGNCKPDPPAPSPSSKRSYPAICDPSSALARYSLKAVLSTFP